MAGKGRKPGTIIHYVDPVLKIMRKCAKKKRAAGESGLMRMYRDLQEQEPVKFLQQLAKLEAEHTKAVNEHKKNLGRMGGDHGSEACIEMVERLLERHKAKVQE